MLHRKAIRENGPACLLRYEVVHHAEEARGQEKAHRVVPIPPLHHRIDYAGVYRVGLHGPYRQSQRIDDMQYGYRDDKRAEKPVGNIDMLYPPLDDGAEENDGVSHPHQSNEQINGPFQFRIFFAGCNAKRQCNRRSKNNQLPAPKSEADQRAAEQARVTSTLHNVVGGGKQCTAAKREDHGIGMQWPEPPK